MAFPTIAAFSLANVIPASVVAVYAKPSGGLWQTLGAIADAEIMLPKLKTTDSLKRNKAYAVGITGKATMLQASLVEIELLDAISAGTVDFLFKLRDWGAIPTGGAAATTGWAKFTSAQIGAPQWKIILSDTTDTNTKIELTWKGSLLFSEVDAAVKASIDDDEFESSTPGAGTLHAIGIYTAAKDGGLPDTTHIKPAGVSSITLADTGGAAQTVGKVRNVDLTFECVGTEGQRGEYLPYLVNINAEYEWLETDNTNLLNLDAFDDSEVDVVITMLNGLVMTMTNRVGIDSSFQSPASADEVRSIKLIHTGSILKTEVDGVFS